MNKGSFFFRVFLFLLSAFSIHALELKDNSSYLAFDEKDGVWQMHYDQGGTIRPLYENRDTRTTYINIVLDNRTYRLQKSSFFNQHLEEYPGLVVVHWSNKILHVTQSVQVDHQVKGFRVNITVRNLSKNYISVGLKQLIDTFNNAEGPDFLVDGDIPVNSEIRWSGADVPAYWETYPSEEDGFRMSFTPLGDRKPDQLIFSNWKRLNDSEWDFNVREGRDFSLLPYSINDSAAAVFYNPVSIPPGTELAVQYALTAAGPVLVDEEAVVTETAVSVPAPPPVSEKSLILNYSFRYDLELIDKYINEINVLLESDDPVYNAQTDYYQEELEKLKLKLSQYENLQ